MNFKERHEAAKTYGKYHYRVPLDVGDMSDSELDDELRGAQSWYRDCEEIGQGINTKEACRRRMVEAEMEKRGLTIYE